MTRAERAEETLTQTSGHLTIDALYLETKLSDNSVRQLYQINFDDRLE